MEATSDETCIIPLPAGSGNGRKSNSGKNKNKGSASKAGSSSSKKVDVGTYRLRTATKMITHLKFLQASFRELDSKVKEFYKEQADFKTKALSLKSSGVSEDRLLSDQSLQLGDDAALVKMMYNVLDRHRLLQFLSLGSDSMDVSDLEGGSADPSNGTENARKHIQSDPFLTEQCQGEVQAYVDIKNPEKIYESLNTKDCIDNQHEELMKVVKGVKTCISSLRRSLLDFVQMVKSTNKARERFQEQMARATGNPKSVTHGGLQGRPNLQSMADSDPEVLKIFKLLGCTYFFLITRMMHCVHRGCNQSCYKCETSYTFFLM